MTRREFGAGMLAGAAAPAAGRPNVVFLCADQHSGPVLGAMGHYAVRTPNLDRLAGMGVMFRNAYSGNPVCVPARASMMTGRFASDVGSFCNSTPLGAVPSWGNALRDAGYECWATGKLDLTGGADYGFREVNTSHEHSRNPDITSLFRAPVPYRAGERASVDGQFTERGEHHDADLARAAAEFVRSRQPGRPWAAYVGMTMPHPRWVARERYRGLYPLESVRLPAIPPGYLERRHTVLQVRANFANVQVPLPEERVRRARAAYYAMITEVDEYVGRVMEQVDLGNTLLVYTSDHGEMLGENGLWLKNVLLEGAARVPLILAGAGLPRGKVVDTPVAHVDMVATILDMAGAARPRELRGHSLAPLARGESGDHPGFAYSESHSEGNCTGSFMIRRGDWKYLYFTGDEPLLFNLREDPGELRNVAGAAVEKELHGILKGLVEPDAVTERAFAAQERILAALVGRSTAEEFYKTIVGRLGPAQARVLTMRHYRGQPQR